MNGATLGRIPVTPRYDGPPLLVFERPIPDPSVPLLRQRRRLADTVSRFDADQWSAPSRCDGWAARDVMAHLVSTNQFWAASATAALAGRPTRLLGSFDPVTTPARLVEAVADVPPEELLARFVDSNEALARSLDGLDPDQWLLPAEVPPGHVALQALALHALWDAWIHERDILVPQGQEPPLEADEVAGCLCYASALGPVFLASGGSARLGTLGVRATEPTVEFVIRVGPTVVVREGAVEAGSAVLAGCAVELVEALSCRGPSVQLDIADRWMVTGLSDAIDPGRRSLAD